MSGGYRIGFLQRNSGEKICQPFSQYITSQYRVFLTGMYVVYSAALHYGLAKGKKVWFPNWSTKHPDNILNHWQMLYEWTNRFPNVNKQLPKCKQMTFCLLLQQIQLFVYFFSPQKVILWYINVVYTQISYKM